MRERDELKIKASEDSLQTINDFIHSFLPQNCDEILKNQIDLAVEEIFVNIAHYSGTETAEIKASFDHGILEITFSDRGRPFNPLEKEDPDITLSAEKRKIGGLGIFLTKKFMDSVEYNFEDGKNILTLKKDCHAKSDNEKQQENS